MSEIMKEIFERLVNSNRLYRTISELEEPMRFVLNKEESKELQDYIEKIEKENRQLKKELHALEISEEQWLEETLGSGKEFRDKNV